MPHTLRLLPILTALLTGMVVADDDAAVVDRLRAQAGLPPLQADAALQQAAARHAAYLDRHREPGKSAHGVSAHSQQPGSEGFSGESPPDRALAAGYPQREVLENVSIGYADAASAIEGLMAAIYHRLTFLNLEADQLGVAVGERSRVYLLGRSDIGRLCEDPPPDARYRTPVDCLGRPMTRDHYEAMCTSLPDQALFRPAHAVSCANGARLDAAFMAKLCARPSPGAAFRGYGRYYEPCDNGTRLDADWFDALCQDPPRAAAYPASGRYVELCEPPRRVYAEWFEAQCAALPDAALYRDSWRYRRPCADGPNVRVEYLDRLDAARLEGLPEVVLWPPENATGIPPAFYLEEPDPLPDLAVSGYPLSVQFNPARAGRVELTAFRLSRIDGDARVPVEGLRLLDADSDPHGLLTRSEFALFPLERLDWGARYQADVEALVDGEPRRYSWSFATQGDRMPLLTAAADSQRFVVRSGEAYLLYLPPLPDRPYTVLSSRVEHRRGNQVTLEVVDPNTLRVQLDARYCDRVRMQFDGDRRVELVPAGCPG